MIKKENIVNYMLILLILLGIFLRFYGLPSEYIWSDEQYSFVSAIKIHSQDLKSGIMYFQEHPGLGKWLVALPVNFISANYAPINALGPNMFTWAFIGYEAVTKNYVAIRIMNAILGSLAILFIYLIMKKLFNKEAALWGAAIMAISPDMIAYSRHEILMKIISISLVLGTLFFYIKYLSEKSEDKKWLYLGMTILVMTFAIGSRNFDPLFIIPTLIISQFFINREKNKLKENLIVTGLIIASFLFVFYYTYPSEAKAFAQQHLQAESPFQLLGFTFPSMIVFALTRNSYIFSLTFILIVISFIYYLINKNKSDKESGLVNLLNFTKNKDIKSVLIIFLAVSFFGIGLTRLGSGHMYNITFYASVFLLAGLIISKLISKYKVLKYVFILILIINIVQVIPNFPYSTWEYSNLGLGKRFYENNFDKEIPDSILNELNSRNNPPVMTSSLNTLVFYKGEKIPIVILQESRCNEEYFKAILKSKILIIHKEEITKDQYICQIYKSLPLKEVKNFKNQAFIYEII